MDAYLSSGGQNWTSDRTGATCTYYIGEGSNALEVVVTEPESRPRKKWIQDTWTDRRDGRPNPILLIATYTDGQGEEAVLCGPSGEDPEVVRGVDPDQAGRIAAVALEKPSRIAAQRFLSEAIEKLDGDLVGIRNQGLLATHELRHGVPERDDWDAATSEAEPLLDKSGQELVEGLGYEIERGDGEEFLLKHGSSGQRQAVAVFVDDDVPFDSEVSRFNDTPVGYALNAADRQQLDYVVASDGDRLRLYTTDPDVSFGSRGRTDTYVEVDTSLVSPTRAGYLWLLFSADALRDSGTLAEIQSDSEDYATKLSNRLRQRIYDDVVPDLAEAISEAREIDDPDREQLDETYEMTLYLLYRLLFVAYAEDERHLPRYTEGYERRSLKETAKELHQISQQESTTFGDATTYWSELQRLFEAIHDGQSAWALPEYDGTLLSSDPAVSPAGARLAEIELTDEVFAPILYRLLVDETPDEGVKGPVDFRNVGVREFGVIYEGLLESELSQADRDLTLNDDEQYVPADEDDEVIVAEGEVYLHGLSGERKATGTYYTKSKFVEHLLDHSLEPALEDHLAELDDVDDAEAAEEFFDFRVADIAMGSGHFLVGAVDRIEKAFSDYLAERSLDAVEQELHTLRTEALSKFEHTDAEPDIERDQVLRRQIARRCVYGVDLNPLATELARLSLWIHTFVPGLPLTFLDYNLRTGDSLAGVGTLEEVSEEIDITDSEQVSLGDFADTTDTDLMDEIEAKIERLGEFADASAEEVAEARALRSEIESELASIDARFDVLAAARIDDDDRVDTAVASDRNVDDVTVTSSYDAATELLASVDAFHFPTAFPEVFVGENPGFDAVMGNPPWEEATMEEKEFWSRYVPGLQGRSQSDVERIRDEKREERPDLVEKYEEELEEGQRRAEIIKHGPFPGAAAGGSAPDTYKAFNWRFRQLLGESGHAGLVLPRSAFSGSGSEDFRRELLTESVVNDLTFVKNKRGWVFDNMEHRYTIALLGYSNRKPGENATLPLRGPFTDERSYESAMEDEPVRFAVENALNWTETASFPLLPEEPASVSAFQRMNEFPALSTDTGAWTTNPCTQLNSGTDKTKDDGTQLIHFVDDPPKSYWPVMKGSSFDIWEPETGEVYGWADPEVMTDYLYEKRANSYRYAGSRSPFSEMPQSWIDDESTLPCYRPRVAFRDITNRTNSRTTVVSLIPPNVFIVDTGPFLLFPRGDERDESYVLGVMSSILFDWYSRRFVETHLNYHILNALPVPRPGRDDTLRQRVVELAGHLAAVDDRYADWADAVGVDYGPLPESEKQAKIHELDAVVAHLYGLTREHVEVIFETFHANWNHEPRLDAVLDHYDEWAEKLAASVDGTSTRGH
jgi:hypothetical protein